MKFKKKTLVLFLLITLIFVFTVNGFVFAKDFMSLATASMGGTYYIVGASIAEILDKNLPDISMNGVIAQGSVGNPKLVDNLEADLGMTNYYSGSAAIKGEKPYEKSLNIAGICSLQFSILHFVTFADRDDLNSISDLAGKEIAVGPAGGGGVMAFSKILPFWNLTLDDVIPSYLSYTDGSSALKDGNVDVTMPHGAPPLQAITQLALQKNIKFIEINKEKFNEITKKYPYYENAIIPAGTYNGVNRDISVLGINDILIVNKSIDEDTVYQITKILYENIEKLKKIHPSMKNLTFNGYKDSLVPLHSGAKKFYDEMGIEYK